VRRSWTSGRLVIVTAALCALAASGCTTPQPSGIDPTGEHVFAVPPRPAPGSRTNEGYYDQPMGRLPWDDASVELHPRETVAAVGSEVVLIAGVCGSDGYLRTNRRLEWSIDPGGVGQFVAVGETGLADLLVGDFNRPRKVTNTFAIGSTLRTSTRLNRGTCRPEDSVYVLRGEGWISLTSSAEGTSNVTVFAPEVYTWDARLRSAIVHWVDAQWRFPPPAINPAGSRHVFTTTVTRQSNQTPCERWLVRYEIVEGPPAGFAPDGATSVEVPTDHAGQASVEIFQKEPKHGTNKICIQVIRPGDLPGANGRRLVVGTGTTMKTWTSADLSVTQTGPAAASPGAAIIYRIDVSNPGDLPAKDVTVVQAVPDGLAYVNSNPPAETAGRQLQWRLGELGPRQRRVIDVTYRAERQGSVVVRCDVAAAGGLKVSQSTSTTIATASLDVRISGPAQAAVGSDATFQIVVTNLSQAPVTGLVIRDRLDQGLVHPQVNRQNNAIEKSLGTLAPGASQRINVTVRVTQPGSLCQTVEVSGQGIAPATAQASVTGVGGTPEKGGQGVVPPFGGTEQPRATPAKLTVKKTCSSKQFVVGETARFTIEVTNAGTTPAQNVKLFDRYDPALLPVLATDGYRFEDGGMVWTIDNLAPGKTTSVGMHCTCQAVSAKASNRATATTADGAKAEDEVFLEIRAAEAPPGGTTTGPPPIKPSGGLSLSVEGLSNPVIVGKELTYDVRVRNEGSEPCRQVSVTATAPDGMLFDRMATAGPEGTNFDIKGQVIRFDPVAELAPKGLLVYRIRVQATKAGPEFRFHVEAGAQGLPQPLVREATTEVNQKPTGQ
jgi:uncharacterized repeat protein (TIGR01451 family)